MKYGGSPESQGTAMRSLRSPKSREKRTRNLTPCLPRRLNAGRGQVTFITLGETEGENTMKRSQKKESGQGGGGEKAKSHIRKIGEGKLK